jgi:hypothetical protein
VIVEVDGQRFDLPDDASHEEIDAATRPAAPAPASSGSALGDVAEVVGREIVNPIGSALRGAAHGMVSGTGPVSRAMKSAFFYPDELAELERQYQGDPDAAKKVGNFVGEAYTPENAAIGQAVGASLGVAAKSAAGPVGRWLESVGLKQGRRVLTGGADPLAVKKPIADAAVAAAFDKGAIAPGRTTQYAADVLNEARGASAKELGALLDELEAKGVKGPDALALARSLRAKAADLEANSAGTGAPELYRKMADEIEQKIPAYSSGAPGPASPELELNQAESIKRSLQEKARYDRVQGDKIIEGARKDIASTVRQGVEDSITRQSVLAPKEAARFVPLKEELGNLIEASNAANKGAAQAARRNAFSLRDMILGSGASAAGAAAAGPLGTIAGPVTTIASHVARTRGTPTAAWLAYKAGQALENAGAGPVASGVSKVGPVIASETQGLLGSLGWLQPAAAGNAGTGSTPPAPQGVGTPNAPGQPSTPGPGPWSPSILGAGQDPADHMRRWFNDPAYQQEMRGKKP